MIAARLLDLTRSLSRAGRMPTGIDRVERAYLGALPAAPVQAFGLIRTLRGDLLLDAHGMAAMARALDSGTGRDRLLGQLRGIAIGRSAGPFLRFMLKRHLPPGTAYINVGHSNLTERVLAAVRHLPGSRITVMIHDTIPLDWPDLQREGTPAAFAARLERTGRHADIVLCPSHAAAADVDRHLRATGFASRIVVAPLGVTVARPDPALLPPGLPPARPYFVMLGTIEPRKNHAMMLDIWARLGGDPPPLVICGSRGWRSAQVFAWLDARPAGVTEIANLPDAAVAALVAGARALLFPSRAEGFGIPLVEAAALGTPVIAADIPAVREILGARATILPPDDVAAWESAIRAAADSPRPALASFLPPDWETHFNGVLSVT